MDWLYALCTLSGFAKQLPATQVQLAVSVLHLVLSLTGPVVHVASGTAYRQLRPWVIATVRVLLTLVSTVSCMLTPPSVDSRCLPSGKTGTIVLMLSALVNPLLVHQFFLVQLVQLTIILAGTGFTCRGSLAASALIHKPAAEILQHVVLQYIGALAAPLLLVVLCEAAYRRSWLQARTRQATVPKGKLKGV